MDFYSLVAQRYMSGINFHNTTVDEALRQLLFRVKLPGSSQYMRRLLKGSCSLLLRLLPLPLNCVRFFATASPHLCAVCGVRACACA
jgi:hypothetical protein